MKDKFFEWYGENSGLFWGIIIGLLVAILFLTIGFLATILIALCVGVGAFLGSRQDFRLMIKEWFMGLFTKRN